MTDNIITKDEAIDRMKAGLSCETYNEARDRWNETAWAHFDMPNAKFRKPPEPRRVAREWRRVTGLCFSDDHPVNLVRHIHVREVLPGDVVLQRMTVHEALVEYENWRANYPDAGKGAVWLASRRALGLIDDARKGTKTAIAEQRPACCEQGLNYPGGVCPRCHELFGSIPP